MPGSSTKRRGAAVLGTAKDELLEGLRRSNKASVAFGSMPASRRKRWVDYVTEAKRPETRARRIDRCIRELSGVDDNGSQSGREAFGELKRIARRHARQLTVATDRPDEFILAGPHMARWNKELWFGGVRLGKRYVSYHLMPVYMFPDLLDGISAKLRARMQGKSCFNFKKIEPELFTELDALTRASVARLRREGIL